MLDRMEEAGLVIRLPDVEDRRQIIISITEKAKQYKETYDNISEKMNEIFYEGFTTDEVLMLETLLERIIANLESNMHS